MASERCLAADAAPALAGARVLAPMDTVRIGVLDEPDLSATTRVEPDGTINLPYVGRIRAAGRTEDQLGRTIERRLIALKIPQGTVIPGNRFLPLAG